VFDASDIEAESSFWAGLLDGTVHRDDDWHSIVVDGEWIMGVQLAPNHVAPDWPTGAQQQQVHLDTPVRQVTRSASASTDRFRSHLRQRVEAMQNSLPSGSAITVQV
jgi:hypothetical protein